MATGPAKKVEDLQRQLAVTADPGTRVGLLTKIMDGLSSTDPEQAADSSRRLIEEARAAGLAEAEGQGLSRLAYLMLDLGKIDESRKLCAEALELAEKSGIRKTAAMAYNTLGLTFQTTGDYTKATEYLEQCLKISREIGYEGGISTALSNLSYVCYPAGRYDLCIKYTLQCLELEQKRQDWFAIAGSMNNLGAAYFELGDWENATEYFYRGLAIAEDHDYKVLLVDFLGALGFMNQKRGRTKRALEFHRQSVEFGEKLKLKDQLARSYSMLAGTLLDRGELSAATVMLDKCEAIARDQNDPEEQIRVDRIRAEVLLASGRLEEAGAAVEAAVARARVGSFPVELGIALRTLGKVQAAREQPEAAHQSFSQSIAILSGSTGQTAPGSGYELALAYLAFARFLVNRDIPAARANAEKAEAMFHRLGILGLVEEARTLLRETTRQDVPLVILADFSSLATWSAPLSEIAPAVLHLLGRSLRCPGAAMFLYARQPYVIGRVAFRELLALPHNGEISVGPAAVVIPIRLGRRSVGVLYLSEPAPEFPMPELTFWETIADLLTLILDNVRRRAGPAERAKPLSRPPDETPKAAGIKAMSRFDQTLVDAGLGTPTPDTQYPTSFPDAPLLKFGSFVSASPALGELLKTVEQVAPTRASVLVRGESGTGKELIAQAVHNLSPRAMKPFVPINCAALPETLLEAELFGVAKGVATGVRARTGKMQQAHEGTIFLDEIGDMSLGLQAKLLRALQEHVIEPVGGPEPIPVDVRVVAATNQNLEAAVEKGNFREDLYHRLNVITLQLPPLRERREEIPALAEYFIRKYSEEFQRPVHDMSEGAFDAILHHDWPGNVRELEHAIERAVIVAREGTITAEGLPPAVRASARARAAPAAPVGLKAAKRSLRRQVAITFERDFIISVLARNHGRTREAAAELNLSRSHFYRVLKKLGIPLARDAPESGPEKS